jgi:hypothetical protein
MPTTAKSRKKPKRSPQSYPVGEDGLELTIPLQKVCWLVAKAHEFDVKDVSTESDPASNATDDRMLGVLEDRADDPVEQELRAFIWALSEDEQIDLVALVWLGRDDNTAADWPALREEAERAHRNHPRHTADYLLGEPLLGDFLEEALSILGRSCEDYEIGQS